MTSKLWSCGGVTAAAVLAAVGLTVMEPAAGASATQRESRAVAPFERVVLDAPGELLITQGQRESLTVEAEAHLLPLLRTRVEGGTLVIGVTGSVQTRSPIRFHVALRTLTWLRGDGSSQVHIGALQVPGLGMQLSGASRARVAELTADRIDVELDGSGALQVQHGQVRRQQIRIDDAASYDAPGLHSDEAQVEIRGSGQARVHAGRSLEAQIADSGRLSYSGAPRLSQRVSDAAELLHVSN